MKTKIIATTITTKTSEKKMMMTKTNEINEAMKTTKAAEIEKTNEIIEIKAGAERGVNPKIRISIIIFTMKRSFAKRASAE